MQFNLQIWLNYSLVCLAVAGGLVIGMLGGRLIRYSFTEEGPYQPPALPPAAAMRQLQEEDLEVIISRSLFDATSKGARFERSDVADVPLDSDPVLTSGSTDHLSLVGTIVAGPDSLALILTSGKVEIYGLSAEVSPGITVSEIERRKVVLLVRGERRELLLVEQAQASAPQSSGRRPAPASGAATESAAAGVVDLGEGRFRVDRGMVDNARANMGALLQSARMIPQMENGQTAGFRLVGMQRGSLLEQLGLRLGDVVVEINRVKLDSPEKALQVFQQVREANNISLGLIRNGQPQTFEYSLE